MTVLGSGNDRPEETKSGDKALLVAETKSGVEISVMPGRGRLVSMRRRKSLLTVALVMGFIILMLAGLFLTICFVRKIGPFRRHYRGLCIVGSKKFNGHHKVFESYEITDKYALIHVPTFRAKHGSFDAVKTLHVFDKKVTVIQHHNMCFVKPMMKYHMLQSDWLDNLRMLSKHHFRTPNRFANFHLRIIRPQLPPNYLRDEVDHMADAICNNRPVFRLVFWLNQRAHPWMPKCDTKCDKCDVSQQFYEWKLIGDRKCRQCQCKKKPPMVKSVGPLKSSTKVDSNCKSIRCENKCANKDLLGCVKCTCMDVNHVNEVEKKPFSPLVNEVALPPMIINENVDAHKYLESTLMKDKKHSPEQLANKFDILKSTERSIFNEKKDFNDDTRRVKRSADASCKKVAKIFEGYMPLDLDAKVPLDHIYDC